MVNNLTSKAFSLLLHLILLFLVVDSQCTNPRKYDNSDMEARFKSWLQRHDKHYKDKGEWMLRFGIYQANLNFIDYINAQNLSYKLGDNEFADLTNDEFKALYFGRRLIVPQSNNHNDTSTLPEPHLEQQAPAATDLDWRKMGAVNPIKSQGQCGSCWAFSATAGVESATMILSKNLFSLSEQDILDCDTAGQDKGCKGGYKDGAFKYIQAKGIATTRDYPYKGAQGKCQTTVNKAAKITGFKTVAANSEAALLEAVNKQPVSVSVEASGKEFQMYKSGIFNGKCGTKLDHDLIIVGYGEATGQKFWIIRNSWGTRWGEAGYMRILRGGPKKEGSCGLAMMPSYPLAYDIDI